MPDEIINGEIPETDSQTPAAPSEQNVNLENQPNPTEGDQPKADELEVKDDSTAQEGAEDKTDKTPQPPEHFRKGYEALEKDVKEKYKPVVDAVEQMGGLDVIKAIAPLAEIAVDENADPATIVKLFRETFLPQHMEAIAWAAMDDPSTQEIILSDPEVLQVISEKLFNGKSISDVQAALEFAVEAEEDDPEKAQLKKQLASIEAGKKAEEDRVAAQASDTRINDFQKRFFVDTADEVVKQFNLVAPVGASEDDKQLFSNTVEDIRYAAQGRFLAENQQAYLQIQEMVAKGFITQARVAEARLHNKWTATLLKTAERHSKQLRNSVEYTKSSQQAKVQGVRPDVSGNAGQEQVKNTERYDPDDPNFLTNFMAQFKSELANRA
jgi:hypothetical protein